MSQRKIIIIRQRDDKSGSNLNLHAMLTYFITWLVEDIVILGGVKHNLSGMGILEGYPYLQMVFMKSGERAVC